jgi:hypothetical protein
VQEATDHRSHAVGANHDITFRRVAGRQRHGGLRPVDGERTSLAAQRQIGWPEGLEQHAVQRRAQDDHRRVRQHISHPCQVEPTQQPSRAPVNRAGSHFGTLRDDALRETESLKRRDSVRGQQQRETQRARVQGALEHAHAPSGTLQRHTRSDTTDPRANDERQPRGVRHHLDHRLLKRMRSTSPSVNERMCRCG